MNCRKLRLHLLDLRVQGANRVRLEGHPLHVVRRIAPCLETPAALGANATVKPVSLSLLSSLISVEARESAV